MNALISLAHGLKAIITRVGVSQAITLKICRFIIKIFRAEGPSAWHKSPRERKKEGKREDKRGRKWTHSSSSGHEVERAASWACWRDFFFKHVDSLHSALISVNSDRLAGAGSIQEGVIMQGEEGPAPPSGLLRSDWSGARVATQCSESYRAGSDNSFWLAALVASDKLPLRNCHLFQVIQFFSL